MPTRRYTIRELADELHVTKPGIRKLMTDSFRKQYTETEGNRILINSAGARVIRKHFRRYKNDNKSKTETKTKNSSQKQRETVFDTVTNTVISAKQETIDMLKEQLKAKDDQIANMQKLMDQNQQLLLNTQAENKRLLALTHNVKNDNLEDGEYQEQDATLATERTRNKGAQSQDSTEEKKPGGNFGN